MGVEIHLTTDGGRHEKDTTYKGYDAADKIIVDQPSIAYSLRCGIEGKYTSRNYVFTDLEEERYNLAKQMYPNLVVIGEDEDAPRKEQFLRIAKAEPDMIMSIEGIFWKYMVNDTPGMPRFIGDWRDIKRIEEYKKRNSQVRELAVAVMGNDQTGTLPRDLDDMIEHWNPRKHDTLIGYTLKKDILAYLKKHNLSQENYQHSRGRYDNFDGYWMRHNCLFTSKIGDWEPRFKKIISFYNKHRGQKKMANFTKLALYSLGQYWYKPALVPLIYLTVMWSIAKYYNNLDHEKIAKHTASLLTSQNAVRFGRLLLNHRVDLYTGGHPACLYDIDAKEDIPIVETIVKKRNG